MQRLQSYDDEDIQDPFVSLPLPDSPRQSCEPEWTERLANYLAIAARGRTFNETLEVHQGLNNPALLANVAAQAGIDQLSSNLNPEIYDCWPEPHLNDCYDQYDKLLQLQQYVIRSKADVVLGKQQQTIPKQRNPSLSSETAARIAHVKERLERQLREQRR